MATRNKHLWIVANDECYYPTVVAYRTYKEAKKAYDEFVNMPDSVTFIAKVKDAKGDE